MNISVNVLLACQVLILDFFFVAFSNITVHMGKSSQNIPLKLTGIQL